MGWGNSTRLITTANGHVQNLRRENELTEIVYCLYATNYVLCRKEASKGF